MNKKTLKDEGFTGFRPLKSLDINRIPHRQGIFVVLLPTGFEAKFLTKSSAGTFKKKNPTLPQAELAEQWVEDAEVLFIGKASPGSKGNRGLRRQVQEFVDFGKGKPPGHWDGRLIWQLAGAGNLLVAWKELPPEELNAALAEQHAQFCETYGALPFANLVQARA